MSSTTVPQLLPGDARPVVKARRPVPVQQLQLGAVLVVVTKVLVVVVSGILVDVVLGMVVVVVSTTMVVDVVPTIVVVVTGFTGHVQSS